MRSMLAGFALGAFLALVGASPALATRSQSFWGEIGKVDSATKTLLVKAKGTPPREMTFQVAPGAKIMMGARALDLGRLKTGEHVKVTYVEEGVHYKAQRIEVTPPKTASAKKPMK
jgi:hypothetical protein